MDKSNTETSFFTTYCDSNDLIVSITAGDRLFVPADTDMAKLLAENTKLRKAAQDVLELNGDTFIGHQSLRNALKQEPSE